MDLVVFDLDGTLLNGKSEVSDHTRDTLARLRKRGIAYTVATGRTLHGARDLLTDHAFGLPHIYKNGVVIWQPERGEYSHSSLLSQTDIRLVLEAFIKARVTPFIFTLEPGNRHAVYHLPMHNDGERRLAKLLTQDGELQVLPVTELPPEADITNVSALGESGAIDSVALMVQDEPHLVAYAGAAFEGEGWHWIDVHHSAASKGNAITQLKRDLGVSRVICFGDGDNDLSMFAMADESYAPENAKAAVKDAATATIGHHDEDGVSAFLRQRFDL